jgi:hypothetical protein
MDILSFFNLLPVIMLGIFVAVIGLLAWMAWRAYSPAAPGINLGSLEILGRYGGGKLLDPIKGNLVDATALFLDPRTEQSFKKHLCEDVKANYAKLAPTVEDAARLKEAAEAFEKDAINLSDLCRIIVTRKAFFGKIVIVQWGHLAPLSEYAAVDPKAKFTFSMGFLAKGVVNGEIDSMPESWVIRGLGECTVKLFKPDMTHSSNPEEVKVVEAPTFLARLALYAKSIIDFTEILRSKDETITQLKRETAVLSDQSSASATEADVMHTAVVGFRTTSDDGGVSISAPRRFGVIEFIYLFVPTTAGYFITRYLNYEPYYGIFAGLGIGAYLLWRRRS